MTTTQELLQQRKARIAAAVALEKPDRVPVVPLGDAFAANMMGVKISDFCTKPEVAYPTMIDAFTQLGDLDGIQHASYNVAALSTIWLSKVRWPGRDLPDNELWQVEELELMTTDDYDAIAAQGFAPWLGGFIERADLGEEFAMFGGPFVSSLPAAFKAWEDRGIPVLSPVIFTIPYEYFCGGRSMRAFMLDLYRRPDKVEAAMQATMPFIKETARQVIRGLGITGCWLGGWRSASEFLSPKLWERFVLPYYKELAEVVIEEGITPVFHFDSNWTRDLSYFLDFPKGKCIFSTDSMTDIYKAKEVLGGHMCIMGDVPPSLLTLGTPEKVKEYSTRLVNDLGPTGFILAQGCCIPPDAKPDNVRAMIEAVHG
ncbi:MAG: uroporphyrinogen decarboxylase family protein [Thermoleophilia bacterium]